MKTTQKEDLSLPQTETVFDILRDHKLALTEVSAQKFMDMYECSVGSDEVRVHFIYDIVPSYLSLKIGNSVRFTTQDFDGYREMILR